MSALTETTTQSPDPRDSSVDRRRSWGRASTRTPDDDPAKMRNSLLRYWSRLGEWPERSRLRSLHAVAAGHVPDAAAQRAIAVCALADCSVEVVFTATSEYVSTARGWSGSRAERVEDALQWAGRRLAVRPDAVFAALLAQRDPSIESRLVEIRGVTSSAAVLSVLDIVGRRATADSSDFIAEWRVLEQTIAAL